ncbi:MAG: aminotransferase class I/II-fold pyridoxal phosphate-dependent enzyme [Comamonas sp.]|jgi:histidinol-phosphate aminotransferase|uniref:aminotransferase class I/II-fold pyridoxal phosphate-dependent enzyme n=1 Tax=Comamonas sp. TaxID=34028 RepID=UPI002821FD3D|nr:aminotransferase class I/II-fold pyridoxal phosphate-dependent enzyme [Comamonas sp.]MDR0213782.1 aminotransferase class I/II-fold pyridoxal phosphate-dependent enzyme [Comamonas sp.]
MFDMNAAAMHGGTDAQGVPAHDFSTNRNACGPCPTAVKALQAAHVAQYPDPNYTVLRQQLAAFHGVAVQRILIGGSSSELIHRITLHVVRSGGKSVQFPQHHYGDYLQAARVWRLALCRRAEAVTPPLLSWACEPSSPLGVREDIWPAWQQAPASKEWRVLDCAYRPLWLEGDAPERDLNAVWQLWTPNKALGMTGVRAAYAIAPVHAPAAELQALQALAASWVVGTHGVAMLQAWVTDEAQQWLAQSLATLRRWKAQQLALCERLGWQVLPGHQANYFVARLPMEDMAAALAGLRAQGIKLRDCVSFGLPGHVRLGVLPPVSQAALERAWLSLK